MYNQFLCPKQFSLRIAFESTRTAGFVLSKGENEVESTNYADSVLSTGGCHFKAARMVSASSFMLHFSGLYAWGKEMPG
jgi:hypothetical protein